MNYNDKIDPSYIEYLGKKFVWFRYLLVKNTCRWERNNFIKYFIKRYIENSDVGHFLEVDLEYPEEVGRSHSKLLFLSEKMIVGKKSNLYEKEKHALHIKNLHQFFLSWAKIKKVHKVIK